MCKISIIVPVYNVEKYIRDCLDSLVNQNLDNYEIICINDGSPDNSKSIIEEYIEKYTLIKIINQENQGLSVARNVGLKNAKGEYVFFVDSDDFVEPNVLLALYNTCKKYDLDILDFLAYSYFNGNKKPYLREYINTESPIIGRDYFEKFVCKVKIQPMIPAWLHLYKRDFLTSNNLSFLPNLYFEDSPFTARAYLCANRVLLFDHYVYNYRIVDVSITKGIVTPKHIKDLEFVINEMNIISKESDIKIPMDSFFIGIKNQIYKSFSNRNWKINKPYFNQKIFKEQKFYLLNKKNKFIFIIVFYSYKTFILYSLIHGFIKKVRH